MRVETFRGRDLQRVFAVARLALGEDAMIVSTRMLHHAGQPLVEVVAASAPDVERFQRRLEPTPLPAPDPARGRPLVLALVGPTGAGKTTTLAKLAVHAQAFGGQRVGLLTLDTYRVGAVEQLGTLAEIAGLPMEVVYASQDVPAAMERLADRDVVLVDTPGRGPRAVGDDWGAALAELRPDEVHLVLPATFRLDVAEAVRQAHDPLGPTHLLLSKLDEVPGEAGLAELADRADLPVRWVTDGQEVPSDLRPGAPRILAALGRRATDRAA